MQGKSVFPVNQQEVYSIAVVRSSTFGIPISKVNGKCPRVYFLLPGEFPPVDITAAASGMASSSSVTGNKGLLNKQLTLIYIIKSLRYTHYNTNTLGPAAPA